MHKGFIFILLMSLLGVSFSVEAQELKATVEVTVPKLQTADPSLFKSLESDLEDFLNNQRFTNDDFEEHERIECTFSVNITSELDNNYFTADVALQSLRPVYGSDYKTPLISFADRGIVFQYIQFQQLVDSRNSYIDNLSSVFTFYAYWILGMDYDSFEKNGGQDHFQIMQNITSGIAAAAKDRDKGWTSTGKKNTRYWVIENYLNPRLSTLRDANYDYHIGALDIMHKDTETGMVNMLATLKTISTANRSYPNSVAVTNFGSAKTDEIIEIFKKATRPQKSEIKTVLRSIDPAASSKYNVLN